MTDLQLAITVGAVGVVLWVLAANVRDWMSARKRLSPAQHHADEAQSIADRALSQAQEPSMMEPVLELASLPIVAERLVEHVQPSPIAEAIATLRWQTPIAVTQIQQELRGWRHVGSKPVCFAWQSHHEVPFQSDPNGTTITAMQVGLLLATRSGPLHAMEYSEWQDTLSRLAGKLGAQLESPSMNDVLSKARQLDEQCAAVDAQLTIAVTSNQVLSAASIAMAAKACGLENRGDARFAMGPLHHQRFSVFPGDGGQSMVLLLDVPRTHEPVQAFDAMLECAHGMAEALSAVITDEAGRPLSASDIDQIRGQVAQRAQALSALGIVPGEPVAQRLFL